MKPNNQIPPKLAQRFLLWFLRDDLAEEVQGDLEEQFGSNLSSGSILRAKLRYWYEVFRYLRPFAIRNKRSTPTIYTPMFNTYFKIGWRNLLKNKGYSFINIGGLAMGLTVVMLIGLWIFDELSFNKYHNNYHSIAKVLRHQPWRDTLITNSAHVTGLGTLLRSEYDNYFKNVVMVRARIEERVLAVGDHQFTQQGYFMQPEGPKMFGLKMKHGVQEGLQDMNSILLSESLAIKLFGDQDPVNEIVQMDAQWDLKVTGVYEDLPKNSEFAAASFLAPLDRYLEGWATLDAWDNYHMYIYAQLQPGVAFDQVSAAIKDVMNPHLPQDQPQQEIFLHPMSKWHLYSRFENKVSVMSEELKFVWFYGIIGVFVLNPSVSAGEALPKIEAVFKELIPSAPFDYSFVDQEYDQKFAAEERVGTLASGFAAIAIFISCLGLFGLASFVVEQRTKEIGIRKILGASLASLWKLLSKEFAVLIVISCFVAVPIAYIFLQEWLQKYEYRIEVSWLIFAITCIGVLVITILTVSHQTIRVSLMNPVKTLRSE